jgi:hypothetical protein
MEEIIIGMLIVPLRGNNLDIKIRVSFSIEPPIKSSPNDKNVTLIEKRGTTPT